MNIKLSEGKYVLAVSGGVDSAVLLDVVSQLPKDKYEWVVAHFNHGIRDDANLDEKLVCELANIYGLTFVSGYAELGSNTSENTARTARYDFLRRVCKEHAAVAIITAHHEDDLLETMLLHVLRGTGRYGLSPMIRTTDVIRPLLGETKKSIVLYAQLRGLKWHEDSTNTDQKYLRNRIRVCIKKNLANEHRALLLQTFQTISKTNAEIDDLMPSVMAHVMKNNEVIRQRFVQLPISILNEVVMRWLQAEQIKVNRKLVYGVVIACKTLKAGKRIDLDGSHWLVSDKTSLKIVSK